ncbi:MAG: hypothetical protein M3Z37_04015 [Candidatus Eremiobacteraeota bacterium]|nr:hypothetical protein [Candidatus Eremiobacteraeota bacterium]
MKSFSAIAFLTLLSLLSPRQDDAVQTGSYALQNGSPAAQAHLADRAPDGHHHHLDLWMTSGDAQRPITTYDVEMTKRLHLIIVGADFTTFRHVHPALQPNGHFRIDQQLPHGTFLAYADSTPHGLGQQVFRFVIGDARQARNAQRDLHERRTTAQVDGYTVRLSTTTLRASASDALIVHVLKNGKPAGDLHPYLGASAHAVFLNSADLSYVHVHPMSLHDMEGMPMGNMSMPGMHMGGMSPARSGDLPDTAKSSPDMMLHVALREPGTYKLWLQFRGGAALHVTPFVITVVP